MRSGFRSTFGKLWLILAVAFCLRVALVLFYEATTSRQALSVIPFLFEPGNIAFALSHGQGFSSPLRTPTGPTAWMAPVYPLILAAIFKLFGAYTSPAYLAAVLFNILCSALTCIPVFKAGQRIAGPSVAVTAAWLWAIFPNAILLPVQSMWDTSLAALLAAVILYRTITLTRNSGLRDWCLYGLLWGLTLMTNPTLVLLAPFLFGWLLWRTRVISAFLLAVCIAALCCVPWAVRNYVVFGAFIPFRSVLGLQLWVGNNDRAIDGRPGEVHPLSNSTERESYRRMGELAYMGAKKSEALHWIVTHPQVELHLTWVRFVETWTGGSPHPLRDLLHIDSIEFRSILLFNLLVAAGTLVGLGFVLQTRNSYWFPLAMFPLLLPIPAYLTLSSARYRHPLDPAILLLTAIAIHRVRFVKSTVAQNSSFRKEPGNP